MAGSEPPRLNRRAIVGAVVAFAGTVGALLVVLVVSGQLSNGQPSSSPVQTDSGSTPPGVTYPSFTPYTPTALPTPAPPTPTPKPVVTDAEFACQGDAPNGLDITYGSESSHSQGTGLPFSATMPLDSQSAYYSIQAQLHGGGTVTCTVTVNSSGVSATKSGTASGGYNIADPIVCKGLFGGWQAC